MTPKYKKTSNFRSNDPGPAARELFETSSHHRLEGGRAPAHYVSFQRRTAGFLLFVWLSFDMLS